LAAQPRQHGFCRKAVSGLYAFAQLKRVNGVAARAAELAVERAAIKAALRQETEQAAERGVFGVPTHIIDGELFWGAEGTDFVKAYLADPGVLGSDEMQRVSTLPVGIARK